jgi:predicted porin
MRKYLMASAATLGAVAMAGAASAQTAPPAAPPAYTQGLIPTNAVSIGGANNNNNYQAGLLQGSVVNPTPGTMVIHLNVGVVEEASLQSSSFTTFTQGAPALGAIIPGVTPVTHLPANTAPPAGTYKQNPQSFQGYVRIYPGVDAMATNGLRYGAGVEIRENWGSTVPNGGSLNSTSASSVTSNQSLFIRRAFVYAAGAQWGIIRLGQADGVLGIFDNGVTSMQGVSPSGGMNGSDVQTPIVTNAYMPFPFYAQNGIEYGNDKIVYLSPSFAGIDIGLEYAPSNNNAEEQGLCSDGVTSNPSALGVSGVNANTCSTTSSSPLASDAGRYTNQFEVGARYQGTLGPVAILAHGSYMGSGIVDFTGAPPSTAANGGNPHGWNGKFKPLSIFQGGAAVTVAGLTVGGLMNIGAMNNNGQGTPVGNGGVQQVAFIIGFQYNIGPWSAGVAYEQADSQGSNNLIGVSQRHEWGINPGVDYLVAPGFKVFAEYFYGQRHQGDFNFATGAVGSSAYNDVRGQALLIGSRVYW